MLFRSLGLLPCLAFCALRLSSFGIADQELKPNLIPKPVTSLRSAAPNLRVDLKMVLIPVSVTDAADRPITDLPRTSFRILEDDVEQSIASFAQEDAPISLGLLFDSSGSMKGRLDASVESLKLLFQTTTRGDEFSLVQFADNARLLCPFTPNPDNIFQSLGQVQARGWTALLDAIALGAHQMKSAKNESRVLLILSDGNDNNSRFTEREVRNMVLESNLRIYGIGLFHRPRLLQQLANETGGKVLIAQNLGELPDIVDRLSRDVRTQYMIGYSSTNPVNDGKYRKIRVVLNPPAGQSDLQASWRRGYYAPPE
jgi:VWFA-related protein